MGRYKQIVADIEVISSEIAIEVPTDATDDEIMEELDRVAHEEVRVVNWRVENDK